MGEPASDLDEAPPLAKRAPWAPPAATTPLAAGAAVPTLPLQGREATRARSPAQRPTTSVAGWDIYASVRLDAVNDNGGRPAASARATPIALLTRDLGTIRLTAHGAVDVPLYASRTTPGANYRFGGSVAYKPANDIQIDARLEAARLTAAALPFVPGFATGLFQDGRQLACGPARIDMASCERLAGGIKALKQAGDFTFIAQVAAASDRASSNLLRHAGDASVLAGQLRASRRFSHRFEPYVEISASHWRTPDGDAGRQRFVAGALFPEISLFSGRLYAGMDRPLHGAALPVLGGSLSWSPRRTLVFAARAETGGVDGPPPDDGMITPVQRFAHENGWRAGRQTRLSLSARWTPAPMLDLTLASAWEDARWRPMQPPGAAREDQTTSLMAALAWAFSADWLARLDVAAIRQTMSPGPPQRRVVTILSLQRML